MGENSYAKWMSGGKANSFVDWGKATMNTHTPMLFISVVLIITAFIWLFGLSGLQTGACDTSGMGSSVASSLGEDLQPNSTYEVIAEFFIVMFLIFGVAMLVYVLTIKKSAQKLIEKNQIYAALIVDGKNDIPPDAVTEAAKQQLQDTITVLGLPVDTVKQGLTRIKEKTSDGLDYVSDVTKASGSAAAAYLMNKNASKAYSDSRDRSKAKRDARRNPKTMSDDDDNDSDDDN